MSSRRLFPFLLVSAILAFFLYFGPWTVTYKKPHYTWKIFTEIKDKMEHVPCAFCPIAKTFPAITNQPVPQEHDPEAIHPQCHLLLNTPSVMAFLDIMPITEGHVLIISREHREKLYDLQPSEGAAIGSWLPLLSRAVMRALDKPDGDWNVVQNNGASAAQVVPHVHYHIIPRSADVPEVKARSWRMFGKGQRTDLDDSEGVILAARIRKELQQIISDVNATHPDEARALSKL